MATDRITARAQRLLKKGQAHPVRRGSRLGSVSSASIADDRQGLESFRPVILENTYQTGPSTRFPVTQITNIIKNIFESYLSSEVYEPKLCRQMSKDISDLVRTRVKDLEIPRYKVVVVINIGSVGSQAMVVASRCLWDAANDNSVSYEFRNESLYAVGIVYGVYQD